MARNDGEGRFEETAAEMRRTDVLKGGSRQGWREAERKNNDGKAGGSNGHDRNTAPERGLTVRKIKYRCSKCKKNPILKGKAVTVLEKYLLTESQSGTDLF